MPFSVAEETKFKELYDTACSMVENAKIVQLGERMVHMLIDASEATVRKMPPRNIVPHGANRGGAKMQIQDIYKKMDKILKVGFSLQKCDCSRAVAFQRCESNAAGIKKFLAYAKAPTFAKFEADRIEALSVGCGHLNQGLAAIGDEAMIPTELQSLSSMVANKGKLDKYIIFKKDDGALESTVRDDLIWTIIHANIEAKYPKLPNILQKALNVEHHIGVGETWDEQIMNLPETIVDHFSTGSMKAPD